MGSDGIYGMPQTLSFYMAFCYVNESRNSISF